MLNKVPAITLAFWVTKTFATTVGETAADYLNLNFHLGLTNTSLIMAQGAAKRTFPLAESGGSLPLASGLEPDIRC